MMMAMATKILAHFSETFTPVVTIQVKRRPEGRKPYTTHYVHRSSASKKGN